jgi:hypothetical protein
MVALPDLQLWHLPGAHHRRFLELIVDAPGPPAPAPPGGGAPLTSSALVVADAGPAASTLRGPTIDVFNFNGGRRRTWHQHPPGGPPSTSSTSVVATAGPAASTPQGGPPLTSSTSVVVTVGHAASTPHEAHHRRLQLRWWLLSDVPQAPPKGPTFDVFNFGGGRCRTCRQHPPGAPPSTSSTSMVAAVGPIASTPRGPAIDVFNFSGGRYRTCHQYPQGAPPLTSSTSVVASTFLSVDGGCSRTFTPAPPGGPPLIAKQKVQDNRAGRR